MMMMIIATTIIIHIYLETLNMWMGENKKWTGADIAHRKMYRGKSATPFEQLVECQT